MITLKDWAERMDRKHWGIDIGAGGGNHSIWAIDWGKGYAPLVKKDYTIAPARDGGYIVAEESDYANAEGAIVFGGELQPCLDYIAAKYKAADDAEAERKAKAETDKAQRDALNALEERHAAERAALKA